MMTVAPPPPIRNVGVIGLGQMGNGIARNLDRKGRLRGAWDIRAIERTEYSTAVMHAPPVAWSAQCDIVLFVVPSSTEIAACLDHDDSPLRVPHPRQTLVDLTTSHPAQTRLMVERATLHGRMYVDAGMTGGARGADAGTLSLMLGGSTAAIDHCRNALEAIATRIIHVGQSTAGHAMKLIHNMVLHTTFLATCEGCRLAEQSGIDLAKAIEVMNAGNARSFITERRFPDHILSGTFDGRSRVSNLAKDLGMAVDLAQAQGTAGRYGALTASILAHAMASGLADEDFTRLYPVFDRLLETFDEAVR